MKHAPSAVITENELKAALEDEREACANIARKITIAAVNITPEMRGLLAQHTMRIAAKIRARGCRESQRGLFIVSRR
jgi:hypothetical protein